MSRQANASQQIVRNLLGRARSDWRWALTARGAMLAAAAMLMLSAGAILVDVFFPLSTETRSVVRLLPPLAAAAILAELIRRAFPGPSDRLLALLLEENHPQLESSISTAVEGIPGGEIGRAFRDRLQLLLTRTTIVRAAPLQLGRPASLAALALAGFALTLASAPGGSETIRQRWLELSGRSAGGSVRQPVVAAGAPVETSLGAIRVTVQPPAYVAAEAYGWDGEGIISVLPGARLTVSGTISGPGELRASVVGGPAASVVDGDGWRVERSVAATDRGLLLEVHSGVAVRQRVLIPLLVLTDRPPEVELTLPIRDLLLATPNGTVDIHASARDDYGVGAFHLAWIRSRGSGESFTFDEGVWSWSTIGRTSGVLNGSHSLDLATLGLEPGDVLHLRAVARDRNSVGGVGEGVSSTRVIRIARKDEMAEATTLTGFPIEAEREPLLSQRMIILLTEELLERAPSLEPREVMRQAAGIANEQTRLREEVGDQALSRTVGGSDDEHEEELDANHDHDSDPITSVNRPLLEAYNAMWEAEGELRIGQLRSSLPAQYRALAIMQQVREAERVFARGSQQVMAVDVGAVRGTGKLEGVRPAVRTASPAPAVSSAAVAQLELLLPRISAMPDHEASMELSRVAAQLLGIPSTPPAAPLALTQAADRAREGRREEAIRLVLRARAVLSPSGAFTRSPASSPTSLDGISAAYFEILGGAP